jgi:hypothetical protein
VEGSAPSPRPDANGFVAGRFGRQLLEHGRRQFELPQENLKESRWKNFACQTDLLAVKYNYRHCSISMPVVDVFYINVFCWY